MGEIYKCIKPYAVLHFYTEPREVIIQPGAEEWELISRNRSTGIVKLVLLDGLRQTCLAGSIEMLSEYFELINQGLEVTENEVN